MTTSFGCLVDWPRIGRALYVASPIDLLPDAIPVIGHLDEVVTVPLLLLHMRRMIPREMWFEHFPPR